MSTSPSKTSGGGRSATSWHASARAEPAYVADLGCGPGNLTRELAARWPGAEVRGVDSSTEMVARAEEGQSPPGLAFEVADLRTWAAPRPVDVLTSNATLQWVPGHLDLLERLVGMVTPEGWLAFQVPGNFGEPCHTELVDLAASPRWRDMLEPHDLAWPASEEPSTYLDRLASLGCTVDVWETTYLQVLQGEDAVLRWMRGTALRPALSALEGEARDDFVAEYAERLRLAYPRESFGTVLPYRRVFAVAHR